MQKMTRRQFGMATLGTGAVCAGALFGLPAGARAAQPTQGLVARPGRVQLAPDGYPETDIWGYDGGIPGPEIRIRQGERVTRQFVNALPQASSVHWHGVRLANGMDGVPGLTQDAVPPGENFIYDFTAPDAGTYWYHSHNRSWEQMARGLYGALILEEAEGAPDVDDDIVLLVDDWRFTEDAQIAGGFGNLHDWSHAGRIGNWLTVNGQGPWRKAVHRHDRLRLRLVNTANARIFTLGAFGLTGWVVALDGMPLATPQALETVTLGPAQRADLIVDVTAAEGEDAHIASLERDGSYAIVTLSVAGSRRDARAGAPAPLPPNPVPPLGPLSSARTVQLVMEGGAMGRMQGAMMNGRMTGMRDMAAAGKVWAFNGMADMPDRPLIEAERGETVQIDIVNDTGWPHAMHLHGHHFRRVLADGTTGPLRDTLLMDRNERAGIAFVADNPGDWLLHCHMLEHSASGMMTWLRVT